MIQHSPHLFNDTLVYEQQGQEYSLRIGTSEWYGWLATASTFSLTSSLGTFTVRKERAGSKRGGWYWKVYHRQGGTLRSAYLGKTEGVTLERLTTVTQRLANHTRPNNQEPERHASPLAGFAEPLTALPLSLTPLLGRDQEILRLENVLGQQERRLVTLTGTGGVGKTHLALHIARKLAPVFADEVVFVSLAAVAKSEHVLVTIARTLGVPVREQPSLSVSVRAFLQKKHILLLLDNFEQVVDAAPQIEALVIACPRLTVLTTSRMALHLRGEQIFPLSPLALPDPTARVEPETLLHSPAVALFVQHAQDHLPSFQLTEANAATVSAICQHLDGLPLALELAAARLPLFSPEALLARLSQRFSLLTGEQQNVPARQQTLRNTLAWSYDLLAPDEQQLFRWLSVFAGGWTLRAVEYVVYTLGDQGSDILQALTSLLDKNLIQRSEQQGSEPRLRFLETMREYAATLFEAQDEIERKNARAAHASFYLDLAEEASARFGDAFHLLLPCLEPEHDNLLVALQWFLEQAKISEALRLGSALEWFWAGGRYWGEGKWWLEQILAQSHMETSRERARALAVAGKLAQMQGEYEQAAAWGHEGLTLFRQLGESQGIIVALTHLAYTEIERGAYDRAVLLGEEAYALEQQRGTYTRGLHCMLIKALVFAGAYARAEVLAEEVRSMSQRLKDQTGLATVHATLGALALIHNDLPTAQTLLEAARNSYQAVGFVRLMLEIQGMLAFLAVRQGTMEVARRRYLVLAQQCLSGGGIGYSPLVLAMALRGLGMIAAQQDSPGEAVRCWSAAERLHSAMFPFEREPYKREVATVRALLGEATYVQAWSQGTHVSPETLLETQQQLALKIEEEATRPPALPPTTLSPVFDTFTAREIAVLCLLAQGKTDRQIAEQLVISPRTVNTHVTSLYRKMDVTSRSAATRYAAEHGFLLTT